MFYLFKPTRFAITTKRYGCSRSSYHTRGRL